MRDEDEGDAGGLLDVLELLLHVLAELQVERGERLVEQQELGVVDEGAGDSHALLLAAGERGDAALFKTGERNEMQHLRDPLVDLGLGHLFLTQREGHVFKHVQVGEERVALEDGVDVALVRGHIVDTLAHEDHVALVRGLKAADDAQRRGLAAARGAEQGEKLIVIDIEIDMVEHYFAVKSLGDVLELHDLFHAAFLQQKRRMPKQHTSVLQRSECAQNPGRGD